jgi:NTP pyrophosphatase (non-canonical NTP hydrolase)
MTTNRQTLQKWVPTTNGIILRRMGKLGEELAELSNVTNRVIIQGLYQVDPSSQKVNKLRLEEEVADVWAQILVTMKALQLDREMIEARVENKVDQMQEWEQKFSLHGSQEERFQYDQDQYYAKNRGYSPPLHPCYD